MSDIDQARSALLRRILEGEGKASSSVRRAAFDNKGLADPLSRLVAKVAGDAGALVGDDIDRAKRAGSSEDQIFEIVVCAAIGQATRQYVAARSALEAARR